MGFKAKGIIIAIGEKRTTKLGTDVQQIVFEQGDPEDTYPRTFNPSFLGSMVAELEDLLPGDVVEIEFHISGQRNLFNNVIVDVIERV